jgi:hypothetical protein
VSQKHSAASVCWHSAVAKQPLHNCIKAATSRASEQACSRPTHSTHSTHSAKRGHAHSRYHRCRFAYSIAFVEMYALGEICMQPVLACKLNVLPGHPSTVQCTGGTTTSKPQVCLKPSVANTAVTNQPSCTHSNHRNKRQTRPAPAMGHGLATRLSTDQMPARTGTAHVRQPVATSGVQHAVLNMG